jgi:abortive infection bacteriophage resistance protein
LLIPCTPLFQAQFAGLFLSVILIFTVVKYTKPPFTAEQHINLLQQRGLNIEDTEQAKKHLITIGYFRLTGYMYHLQSSDCQHAFYPGTTFQDVIQHYHFDKMLRFLTMTYLERIEIALRAQLTDNFSKEHGFFWYTKPELYDDLEVYNQINAEITDRFDEPQERCLRSSF